ncbi:hypothetical protein KIK06_10370 [Nocardiopsis sp. EMB25]|uniref:hypothetical protein n=1 Tax=Nocardiopsis sp. EMB25 TaxID=2835867 RepID=UPI00228471D0|nr:hypothetical protein [Nocardiopsis sp. EMB25]MCY9784296.1 hypothetical protein [Nocardiopsis sp. EMB25]
MPGIVWRQVSERTPPSEPPLLEIGDQELPPLLSTLGGGPESPPESLTWPELHQNPEQARILTGSAPIRVVMLSFPNVNEHGIPDEDTSTEERCVERLQPNTAAPREGCVYYSLDEGTIQLKTGPSGCLPYHVLQATWIRPEHTPDGPAEEYVSYAWKDTTPTCMRKGMPHERQ